MKRGRMQGSRSTSGGPLMTDHLRDLDLELQLLKRKRTMIEQQQRMLSDNRQPFQQDYGQSYGHGRNFSHLYEADHHRGAAGGSQFAQNYHSDAIWDQPPAVAQPRYTEPQQANFDYSRKDRFAPQKKQRRPSPWANPTPLLDVPISAPPYNFPPKPSSKMNRAGPPTRRSRDFKASRVTKPNTHNFSNTFKKQPIQVRKDLVKKASNLVTKAPQSSTSDILTPGVPPSSQMVGRMEFCLGAVLKDMRTKFVGSHASIMNDAGHLRTIKQAIRERIHKAMLGKKVTGNQFIIETYRREFPPHTDKEILQLCVDEETVAKHQNSNEPFLPEDDPEKFFKINFHKLFVKQLDDMFGKIALLHRQQNKSSCEDIINQLPDVEKKPEAMETAAGADAVKESIPETTEKATPEVSSESVTEPEKDTNQPETETNNTEATNTSEAETTAVVESAETTATEDAAPTEPKENEAPEVPAETTNNGEDTEEKVLEANNTSLNEGQEKTKEVLTRSEKTKFYTNLLDQLIEQRLPHFLKQKSEDIFRIMNIDNKFKATRAAIILETNKKAEAMAIMPVEKKTVHVPKTEKLDKSDKPEEPKEPKEPVEKQTEPEKEETTPVKKAPLHYVKILAKPSLPDTKIMKSFLDQFNPKMIKKPKSVHNLLIVGLATEADVEKILTANKATIGNKKLLVSRSEKMKGKKDEEEPKKEDKVITDDLDNQITELLTSIRESEENDVKTEPNTSIEENPDTSLTTEVSNGDSNPITEENGETTDQVKDNDIPVTEATNGDSAQMEVDATASPKTKLDTIKETEVPEAKTELESLKQESVATPTRTSARLANSTPSAVQTRRASKLANQ